MVSHGFKVVRSGLRPSTVTQEAVPKCMFFLHPALVTAKARFSEPMLRQQQSSMGAKANDATHGSHLSHSYLPTLFTWNPTIRGFLVWTILLKGLGPERLVACEWVGGSSNTIQKAAKAPGHGWHYHLGCCRSPSKKYSTFCWSKGNMRGIQKVKV